MIRGADNYEWRVKIVYLNSDGELFYNRSSNPDLKVSLQYHNERDIAFICWDLKTNKILLQKDGLKILYLALKKSKPDTFGFKMMAYRDDFPDEWIEGDGFRLAMMLANELANEQTTEKE
jgi:hypothetical protein